MEPNIYLITFLLLSQRYIVSPSKDIYGDFQSKLSNLFEGATKYKELRAQIHDHIKSGVLGEVDVDVSEVSRTFEKQLRTLLLSYLDDLNAIKTKVRESREKHIYDQDIEPFNYYNDKQDNPVRYEPLFSTDIQVNLNQSFGQVPTDIFKNDKVVLNDFAWLRDLDPVFQNNYQKRPTLLWQYFATENGASKNFPGVNTDSEIDLYDPRRRIWYNQAIMSPKDVVLAVDMSGSMTGSHLTIAKLVVTSLINTLQQDDYFNVIYFNSEVNFLIPCLRNLSEATTANKRAFKDGVNRLTEPTGVADFSQALRTAFNILNRGSTDTLSSSNCSKVIMLISDGITYDDRTDEALADENGEQNVIIFSYIVGLNTDPEMKEIACSTGGAYYQIQTMGNVLDGVLKYQKVLSKPIGKSGTNYVTFTPLYLDGSGLGMMTTISTGVFITTNQTAFPELIGVAGLDIVISLLQQQYPIEKMGVFGHAFAINNNGLFLMHPKFKDQSGYLPDPATVYLPEVENMVDLEKAEELSRKMIDGEIGCIQTAADWLFPKDTYSRAVRLNNTYCYRPLPDTPFFSGVSIPEQNKKKTVINQSKSYLYSNSGIKTLGRKFSYQKQEIAAWPFCDITTEKMKTQPASEMYYLTINDLYEYLDSRTSLNETNCDIDLVSNLLFFTSLVGNFTKTHWSLETLKMYDVLDMYAITASGFMTTVSSNFDRSTILNRDIFEEERFTHPASHFNKDSKHYNIFTIQTIKSMPVPPAERQNVKDKTVAVGSAIYPPNGGTSMIGVVGMTLNTSTLATWMNDTFQNDCQEGGDDCFSFDCKDHGEYECYLIDENGYIVSSNQGNYQIGHFIGYFNGDLVNKLTKDFSVFQKTVWRDTQAYCPQQIENTLSNGLRLETFYKLFFSSLFSLSKSVYNFLIWLFVSLFWAGNDQNIAEAASKPKNNSCVKDIPLYTIQSQTIDLTGRLPCLKHCSQRFKFKSIAQTNIALIVTGNDCGTGEKCPVSLERNEPIRVGEHNICEQRTNYRLPAKKCYQSTGFDRECDFEYMNTDENLFIYLIVGFSVSFGAIVVVVTILPYCRRLMY